MATDQVGGTTEANKSAISAEEFARFEEEAKAVFLDFNSTVGDRLDFIQKTMAENDGELSTAQVIAFNMLQDQFSQMFSFLTSMLENIKQGAQSIISNIGR